MRTVAILQARLASSRLPAKVLRSICGTPMISRMMDRLALAKSLDEIVVAIPGGPKDDELAAYCLSRGWSLFRGAEEDVLGRYLNAAEVWEADNVVRVTADCPLIDPFVIDAEVTLFKTGDYDFVANNLTPSFPHGCDAEVMSSGTLAIADQKAKSAYDREHVTPWITRADAGGAIFRLCNLPSPIDYSWMRLTVDYDDDLDVVKAIYDHFGTDRYITIPEIATFLALRPGIMALNARYGRRREPPIGTA